jgi:hypothetical protein
MILPQVTTPASASVPPDSPIGFPTSISDLPLSYAADQGFYPQQSSTLQQGAIQQGGQGQGQAPAPQPTIPPSANGSFPPSLVPNLAPSPSPTWPGVMNGRVGFPGNFVPSQLACAFHVENNIRERCVDYTPGTTVDFSVNLPPGTYFMAAHLREPYGGFPISYQAYYDEFVNCIRTSSNCSPELHNRPIPIVVTTGKSIFNVYPLDWYAPH